MKVMHKNEKFDARGIYLIRGADRGKGCESHDIREVYSGFVKPFRLNFLVSKTNTHPLTTVSFNFFSKKLIQILKPLNQLIYKLVLGYTVNEKSRKAALI